MRPFFFLISGAVFLWFTGCGPATRLIVPAVPPEEEKPVIPAPLPFSPAPDTQAFAKDTVKPSVSERKTFSKDVVNPFAPETQTLKTDTNPPAAPFLSLIPVERNIVRVFLTTAKGTLRIGLKGSFTVNSRGKNNGAIQGDVSLSLSGQSAVCNGQSLPLPLLFMPMTAASLFQLNGRTYQGSLILRTDSLSKPILVNEVFVEDYLKGVLPYEIGKRDAIHFEALKVQAMAARTYAYKRLNLHAANGFDLFPDESDQVYNGMAGRYALADSAVDATRDEVICEGDTLIQAYYFSTSPGRTANIEEVWPDRGYRPYLRSVNDSDFCAGTRYFTWKETWSGAELERIVNRFGHETFTAYSPGRLQNITITGHAVCGRAKTTLFVVGGREYRAAGDRVRWVLRRPEKDFPILRSAFFTLTIDRNLFGHIRSVTAKGGGYGHGVGFSQIGALSMAAAGLRAPEIIRRYYTGVELRKVRY